MKKILITGGSGLLGTNLALRFRHSFETLILTNKKKIQIPFTKSSKSKDFFAKSDYFKPDLIINTVALTDVDFCEKNPDLAFETNVKYINYLKNICLQNESKLIHISTDHLSDGSTPYIKENHNLNPINQYGKTKLLAENLIKESITNPIILRTNFFGWGTNYRKSFSDRIIDNITSNKQIQLFEDAFFSPVSMRRLYEIILQLYKKNKNGTFNICSNDRISKYNFGLKICDYFNLEKKLIIPISIDKAKDLVIRPRDTSLNNFKITEELEFDCGFVSDNINDLIYDVKDGIKNSLMDL